MIWREIYVSVECVFDCRRRCWQEEGEFSPPPFEVFSSLYDFELKMYREQIHTTLAIAVLVSKTTLKRRQQPQIWTICYFFFAHTEWLVKTILNETKWFSSFARWNCLFVCFGARWRLMSSKDQGPVYSSHRSLRPAPMELLMLGTTLASSTGFFLRKCPVSHISAVLMCHVTPVLTH